MVDLDSQCQRKRVDQCSFLGVFLYTWTSRAYGQLKASAARALNQFISGLYHADLWIPRVEAARIVKHGQYFLKAYCYLAWLSHQKGEPKFSFKPKFHMVQEAVIGLKRGLGKDFVYNIIAESCSIDEDMVGRMAYITRHVSPRLTAQRTLERYLTQVRFAWAETE
jgi:hypothetical protein